MSDLPVTGADPSGNGLSTAQNTGGSGLIAAASIVSPGTTYYLAIHTQDPTANPFTAYWYELGVQSAITGGYSYARAAVTFATGTCSNITGSPFGIISAGTTSANGTAVTFSNAPAITSGFISLWNLAAPVAISTGSTSWSISGGVLTVASGTPFSSSGVGVGDLIYGNPAVGSTSSATGWYISQVNSATSVNVVTSTGAAVGNVAANTNALLVAGKYIWGSSTQAIASPTAGATISFANGQIQAAIS